MVPATRAALVAVAVATLLPRSDAREKSPPMLPAVSCDGAIPGDWTGYFPQPLNDLYTLTWTSPPSPGAWTATMESGGGWGTGKGQFSADNMTTTIALDSGVNLRGNVTDNCTTINWDNKSTWKKVVPKPTITGGVP